MPASFSAAAKSGANEGVALWAKKVPISGYEARAAPFTDGTRAIARSRSEALAPRARLIA